MLPAVNKPSTIPVNLPATVVHEEQVIDACAQADRAERDYALKAMIAGSLLIEYRGYLAGLESNFRGARATVSRASLSRVLVHNQHSHSATFEGWLEQHGIARRTAYRWMEAAERISRKNLGLREDHDLPTVIDVGGVAVPLSRALTAPEAELSGAALEFRQSVFGFMADKTLAEAARAAFDGESPAHRISRAAAGKAHGGASDLERDPTARKDLAFFAGRAMAEALAHIGARVNKQGGHWPTLGEVQKQEARGYLTSFVGGLDQEALNFLWEAVRAEMAQRTKGKRAEPLALRHAVDAAHARRMGKGKAAE